MELCREGVEAVRQSRVVPYDAHKVVTDLDVALLRVREQVVRVVRHQRHGEVQDLPNVVPSRVCVLAVFIRVEPPIIHDHLPTQVDQPSDRCRERMSERDVPYPCIPFAVNRASWKEKGLCTSKRWRG